jgi:hypothetical protein
MNVQPLTPPQETFAYPRCGTQGNEDIDFLKKWLLCRCIQVYALLQEHNRVTVPIEEDIRFLGRLKELVEGLPENASVEQVVADYVQRLRKDAEELKRKARSAAFKLYCGIRLK